MDEQATWKQRTVGTEPSANSDQWFRDIEASGERTFALLGLESRTELRRHARQLRDEIASELPLDISLDDAVEDAGHFAVLGYLAEFEKFSAYRLSATLSLYGKLARVLVDPDPEWLTPQRVAYVERFIEMIADAGYQIVPLADLQLPYSGTMAGPWRITDWECFFFDYW